MPQCRARAMFGRAVDLEMRDMPMLVTSESLLMKFLLLDVDQDIGIGLVVVGGAWFRCIFPLLLLFEQVDLGRGVSFGEEVTVLSMRTRPETLSQSVSL